LDHDVFMVNRNAKIFAVLTDCITISNKESISSCVPFGDQPFYK
jgi:hypothetical protein